MPRYFLNFVAKTMLPDDSGYDFDNDDVAIAHAKAMAKELALTEMLAGCAILITNEADHPVAEVPLEYLLIR